MTDALYHDAIIAHARSGVGEGRLAEPTVSAIADNPLCGDRVTLDLALADGVVAAVGHKVRGCLLCRASASVLAGQAVGMTPQALLAVAEAFARMIRDGAPAPEDAPDLAVFTPVRESRSRHECVLLPFTALRQALAQAERDDSVATLPNAAESGF